MKISIITVVFNGATTIEDTLRSVAAQKHPEIEHIVIDGGSTDGTKEILGRSDFAVTHWVSEPDKGLYDAMNKGLALASGDVVGILNADDFFEHEQVLCEVVSAFEEHDVDAVYANLRYVDASDTSKIVRDWRSQAYTPGLCFTGWMPAHPTLYLKRDVIQKIGKYDIAVGAQADLEYCARAFELHKIRSRFIPSYWVRMRQGGVSNNNSLKRIQANWRSYNALKKLGMQRNPLTFFALKFSAKLSSFIRPYFR